LTNVSERNDVLTDFDRFTFLCIGLGAGRGQQTQMARDPVVQQLANLLTLAAPRKHFSTQQRYRKSVKTLLALNLVGFANLSILSHFPSEMATAPFCVGPAKIAFARTFFVRQRDTKVFMKLVEPLITQLFPTNPPTHWKTLQQQFVEWLVTHHYKGPRNAITETFLLTPNPDAYAQWLRTATPQIILPNPLFVGVFLNQSLSFLSDELANRQFEIHYWTPENSWQAINITGVNGHPQTRRLTHKEKQYQLACDQLTHLQTLLADILHQEPVLVAERYEQALYPAVVLRLTIPSREVPLTVRLPFLPLSKRGRSSVSLLFTGNGHLENLSAELLQQPPRWWKSTVRSFNRKPLPSNRS
jgi:hypothetical protein